MSIKRKLADAAGSVLVGAARLLGHQFMGYAVNRFMEHPAVVRHIATKHGSIGFWSPNELCWWRAQTLLTKEPETIEWIDGFGSDDVYWDIGANVGVYALYAARRGVRVLAFEPSPFNYYALCRNVELNHLGDTLDAYCLAFNDVSTLGKLNMTSVEIGGALSNFGEALDYWGNQFKPQFSQAMIGFSLDDFVTRYNPQFPIHLKIDVDGIEAKIVEGGARVLSDARLKTVSIELDEKRTSELEHVIGMLEKCGLKLRHRKHSDLIEHSVFASSYNYLFVRE